MSKEEILGRIDTLKKLWEHNESCMTQQIIEPIDYYKQLVYIDRECDKLEKLLVPQTIWQKLKSWIFEEDY